jgi:hypothetical protein
VGAGEGGGWGLYDHLMSKRILNADTEYVIHMSFKNYEAYGYGYNSHLLIMSH